MARRRRTSGARSCSRGCSCEDRRRGRALLVIVVLARGGRAAAELIARLSAGDDGALREVYQRHHEGVRVFANRLVNDVAAAEDLVHEVFVALPRAVRRFRNEVPLRQFLIAMAVNHARHHVRAAVRRRRAQERLAHQPGRRWRHPNAIVEPRQLSRALVTALDALPLDQRVAFVLCEVEERSSSEAARIVGTSDGNVRARLIMRAARCGACWRPGATKEETRDRDESVDVLARAARRLREEQDAALAGASLSDLVPALGEPTWSRIVGDVRRGRRRRRWMVAATLQLAIGLCGLGVWATSPVACPRAFASRRASAPPVEPSARRAARRGPRPLSEPGHYGSCESLRRLAAAEPMRPCHRRPRPPAVGARPLPARRGARPGDA